MFEGLWLPFPEFLWNWLDFETPHPMTVPVQSTKQSSHYVKAIRGDNVINPKLLSTRNALLFWSHKTDFTTTRSNLLQSSWPCSLTEWKVERGWSSAGELELEDVRPFNLITAGSSLLWSASILKHRAFFLMKTKIMPSMKLIKGGNICMDWSCFYEMDKLLF